MSEATCRRAHILLDVARTQHSVARSDSLHEIFDLGLFGSLMLLPVRLLCLSR